MLRLYIQPGASSSGWDKVFDDRQKVKIKSPPTDGKANEELIRFLADSFSIPKARLELIRGMNSRQKDVFLDLQYSEALAIFQELTKSSQ